MPLAGETNSESWVNKFRVSEISDLMWSEPSFNCEENPEMGGCHFLTKSLYDALHVKDCQWLLNSVKSLKSHWPRSVDRVRLLYPKGLCSIGELSLAIDFWHTASNPLMTNSVLYSLVPGRLSCYILSAARHLAGPLAPWFLKVLSS